MAKGDLCDGANVGYMMDDADHTLAQPLYPLGGGGISRMETGSGYECTGTQVPSYSPPGTRLHDPAQVHEPLPDLIGSGGGVLLRRMRRALGFGAVAAGAGFETGARFGICFPRPRARAAAAPRAILICDREREKAFERG